jgi:hypothetical protein
LLLSKRTTYKIIGYFQERKSALATSCPSHRLRLGLIGFVFNSL